MANKIVALLLLVCLVVGNVQAGSSSPEEECFNNCHRELDGKHTVMYVNGACMLRCLKWTRASTTEIKEGSRKDGPLGYQASKTEVKGGSRKNGPLESPTSAPVSKSKIN